LINSNKPLFVALNGQPKSGKSTVQRILKKHFNIMPIDDGAVLRQHCQELFNLTKHDVESQEGKASYTEIQGVAWENRKILGEYGNLLEKTFGQFTVPEWAVRQAKADWENWENSLDRPLGYSFGSCRRGQGEYYQKEGGIVIEIVRSHVETSENIWDMYDQRWVTCSFTNDFTSLNDLETNFVTFFSALTLEEKLRKVG